MITRCALNHDVQLSSVHQAITFFFDKKIEIGLIWGKIKDLGIRIENQLI